MISFLLLPSHIIYVIYCDGQNDARTKHNWNGKSRTKQQLYDLPCSFIKGHTYIHSTHEREKKNRIKQGHQL